MMRRHVDIDDSMAVRGKPGIRFVEFCDREVQDPNRLSSYGYCCMCMVHLHKSVVKPSGKVGLIPVDASLLFLHLR